MSTRDEGRTERQRCVQIGDAATRARPSAGPMSLLLARLRRTSEESERDGPTTSEYGAVLECIGLVRSELGDTDRADEAERQLLRVLNRETDR